MKALLLVVLVACGAPALQTVQIVNRTSRPIQELYVYPLGAANHGASRGTIAPNATTEVKVAAGNVEVLAVSAKLKIDEHTRDQPSASGALELVRPAKVIFYDDGEPAPANQPDVFAFPFRIPKPAAPAEPAPEP